MEYNIAGFEIGKFDFSQNKFEHGYLAQKSTERFEILSVCDF